MTADALPIQVSALCALRPLKPTDAARIAELGNEPTIAANMRNTFPHPFTQDKAEAFVHYTLDPHTPSRIWAIAAPDTQLLMGCIGAHPQQDVYAHTTELGYWLGRAYWGRGIATAAVHTLCQWLFDHTDCLRICAGVFQDNTASVRVLEKAGFQHEGTARMAVCKNGRLMDEIRMARLKSPQPNYSPKP